MPHSTQFSLLPIACWLACLTLPGQAADFHPISGISTSTSADLWPISNLIQGPDRALAPAEPHSQLGTGSGSRWVTDAPGGFPSDFIEQTGKPVLTLDLGAARVLNEISVWGYATTNANGVSRFSLRFATAAEGMAGFGTSITYHPSFEPAIDDAERQSFPFTETVIARYVEFTCDDNFFSNGGTGRWRRRSCRARRDCVRGQCAEPQPGHRPPGRSRHGQLHLPPGRVTKELSITNLGTDQALMISSATLQLGTPGADYFSVTGLPLTIPAGANADLSISFDPAANEGCFNVQLDLETSDPERPTVSVLLLAGVNCAPQEPGEPIFSVDSGTFTESIEVSLSTPTQGAVIVFTTDGSLPSAANGTAYSRPITINSSTQLRAATLSGDFPPAVATENYVRLAADVQTYTSALPILIVENYGAGTIPNKGWSTNTQTGAGLQQLARQPAYMQIVGRDPGAETSSIDSTPELTTRIGIRVRGAFSSTWNPKPYSLETWKKDADDDQTM